MPLFEVGDDQLVPFRRVQAGPDLYEREIEDLLWSNLDAFIGRPLFPVARQAQLGGGLIADVLALDRDGRVHVIEVKRDVDRRQLAQCLEYAGWARTTNLDEIAGLFHAGSDAFFAAWTEFTETQSPILIRRPPQLVLVARDLDVRTDSALAFLTENDLPVTVLRVTIYEDQDRRRFIDVDADHEPDLEPDSPAPTAPAQTAEGRSTPTRFEIDGRRIEISDLLDAGLLEPGDGLTWHRPRIGQTYKAVVTETGSILLEDGRSFSSPSRAAMEAADVPAYDGWMAWRTEDGRLLVDVRAELVALSQVHTTNEAAKSHAGVGDAAPTDADQPPDNCRSEVLAAFARLERRHGRPDFELAEIVQEVLAQTNAFAESTIRTHVSSRLCGDAPDNHGTTYDDLTRIEHGRYRRRPSSQ